MNADSKRGGWYLKMKDYSLVLMRGPGRFKSLFVLRLNLMRVFKHQII